MLFRIEESLAKPQALCLAPTRELARQIMAVVRSMGKFTKITTFLGVPGNDISYGSKITEHIVVGTPGRVENLIKKRSLDTSHLKV